MAFESTIRRLGRYLGRTRSAAVVLPGLVPGVWITGHPCAVALHRLTPADESEAAGFEVLMSSVPNSEEAENRANLLIRRLDGDLAKLALPERRLTLKLISEQLAARLLKEAA